MNSNLTYTLRRISIWLGIAILIISMYLSYDGFDGSVSGGNSAYTILGKIMGAVLALTVSALQFIYSSDARGLNKTLKVAGLLSYGYSIYTDQLGAVHLLGMSEEMAWVVAVFCDIVAEPMIAWGLGEALVGDFIGNFMKSFSPATSKESGGGNRYNVRSEFSAKLPHQDGQSNSNPKFTRNQ